MDNRMPQSSCVIYLLRLPEQWSRYTCMYVCIYMHVSCQTEGSYSLRKSRKCSSNITRSWMIDEPFSISVLRKRFLRTDISDTFQKHLVHFAPIFPKLRDMGRQSHEKSPTKLFGNTDLWLVRPYKLICMAVILWKQPLHITGFLIYH